MPSDVATEARTDRAELALSALRGRIDAFRQAVSAAADEVRSDVTHRQGRSSFREEQALIELGPFAIGRIDPARFAALLVGSDVELGPEALDVIQRADQTLRLFGESQDVHRVRVAPGGDLRDAVKEALAEVGSLFGASRAVELARAGTFDPDRHGALLGWLPFRAWNRAERRLAPPLVVELRGDDCLPAGLGEFLDGAVAIVLVARGPTTPAPLARLVTPGTFVMQTADPTDLERLAGSAHPGVALLFDEVRAEQAHFVHDPDAGSAPWERLTVTRLPEEEKIGRGPRAPAWLEDLAHLRALATAPSGAAPAAGDTGSRAAGETAGAARAESGDAEAAPADRLAAWLLAQADLSDL